MDAYQIALSRGSVTCHDFVWHRDIGCGGYGVTGLRWSCLLAAALLLMPFSGEARQVKLRVTTQLPISNHIGVNLVQFKEEVERRSDRTITVEIFDRSQLYKDNEALGAVATGAIEMGSVPTSQFYEKVPGVEIFQQPFLFNFEALVRAATSPGSEIRTLLDRAVLEATSARVLWWQSYGSSVFFSKGQDARHPAGIQAQRVRVFGQNMANFTKSCGGAPSVISASQQYQAVKDGKVDMVMTGITGVDSRDLWKVTDTITRTEHAALEFIVIINEKVWQSLAETHKAIVSDAARRAEHDLREQMASIEMKAYAFARQKGMKIHDLGPNQVAEWRACSSGMLDEFMNRGGELAQRLMAAYGKLRTHPCCSSGPEGTFTLR
jgi:C4-dicarboxylate-binding protein DctP